MTADPATAPAAEPLVLHGDAFARGRAQAELCPDSIAAVRATVEARLHGAAALLASPRITRYLDAQCEFASQHDPEGMAEMFGIAAGYGVTARALFAFLHAGQLSGLPDDGCSAWAFVDPAQGAMVVKNRDLRGPALPLQRVFRHTDPAWGGRTVLCVGSLGAPGAYSSGINSDGFALVDTQVVTTDQGVGLLRYFMMTRLLAGCASVDEAIAALHAMTHAGGGTLVLADAGGTIAAVEIGHSGVAVQRRTTGWLARTNHFLAPGLSDRLAAAPGDPGPDVSRARLARLTAWFGHRRAAPALAEAAAIMASHDDAAGTGLCRHGQEGGSTTVSCAIFACGPGTLYFASGNPCDGAWSRLDCTGDAGAPDGLRDGTGR
ncbi:MAG: hypothetical protein BGP12_17955 [Rhodospirillales bacterium 70-18]|nr:MAG: hypothetical protein BGP12_17955 [Rhodospirillales bacterium 70-18]